MYNKRTFGKSLGASFAVLVVIALVVMSSGVAYAVPLAGIGGFTIQVDKLSAESAVIYPGVGDTSNQEAYPMAVIEQKNVTIKGLVLTKTLDVSSVPGLDGNARVVMSADGAVHADQQMVKVSKIQAETAVFNQQVIDESNSNNPSQAFGITAGDASKTLDKLPEDTRIVDLSNEGPGQVLKDATIQAHYLASSSISLPGLNLKVQYDSDGDGNYNE
jgi:hypothetical protein